jgi:hypothetical protein
MFDKKWKRCRLPVKYLMLISFFREVTIGFRVARSARFDAVSCILCFASVVPLLMFSSSLFEQLGKDLDESGAESEIALPISCGDLQELDADGHRCDVVPDSKVCDSEHVDKVTTPVKQWFSRIYELTTESENDNNHPKHASEPSLQAYTEAIGATTPSITDDSDGKSSSAGEQRPPSPTDSVKTLVYDSCGEDAFRRDYSDYGSPDSYFEAITDDLDGRSTCAHEQRPPSPTDSVKTLEGDYHGSPCRHVKPCGNAADPFNAIDNFDFNPSCALTGLKKFCCRQPSIPQETPTKKLE